MGGREDRSMPGPGSMPGRYAPSHFLIPHTLGKFTHASPTFESLSSVSRSSFSCVRNLEICFWGLMIAVVDGAFPNCDKRPIFAMPLLHFFPFSMFLMHFFSRMPGEGSLKMTKRHSYK